MMVIGGYCYHTSNAANAIKTDINKILITSDLLPKDIVTDLKYFATYSNHIPLKFYAGGFFEIDYRILFSVINSVTGYSMASLQFESM